MNKEKWINDVLESTRSIQRATPPPGLYDQIAAGIGNLDKVVIHRPAKQWIAAAILLVALNIGSIIYSLAQNKKMETTVASNTLFSEIQTGTTYNY